ncbi:hypothetical protein PE36_08551 [Moritella sp. PE36]|nr:hypothetical protein PE36_08551 [Moritella sp. PE36]
MFWSSTLQRLIQCDIAYGCELYEINKLYINDTVVSQDAKERLSITADKVKPLAQE